MKFIRRLFTLLTAAALLLAATAVTPAASADTTLTVSTTTDVAQAGDGACSLREATLFANGGTAEPDCAPGTASGATTIVVPAGTYRLRGQALSLTGTATLVGAGAGSGPGTTTIDAAGLSQVITVGVQANVSNSDMTVTGGVSGQTCVFGCGTNDPVQGNAGGGITNNGGTLALSRVIVTGNRTGSGATQTNCTPQIQSPCPGGDGGQGGGIANFGTTTITNSAVTANSTGSGASGKHGSPGFVGGSFGGEAGTSGSGGNGGGIDNFQTLTIANSTIAGNTTGAGATGADGGNATSGNPRVANVGGIPSSGGDGGSGGGIYNEFGGQLTISGSTISGNETGIGANGGTGGNGSADDNGIVGRGADGAPGGSGGAGGGIGSQGGMNISNSTITDNSVGASGQSGHGGIVNGITPGQVGGANGGGIEELRMGSSLTHVTIVSNHTPGFGGGIDGDGGTINVSNSIISSNQAAFDENCDGVVTDQGGNVEFGDTSCPSGFLHADPRLSPLGSHGGPTQTIALQPGSPAIHHVTTCVLGSDQRGVARPLGSACDSGAYEVAPPSLSGISAGGLTTTSATIAAAANPNLQDATVVVNYGPTSSYGSSTAPQDLGSGNAPAPFTATLGGLAPGATYHYDVVATNADGRTTSSDRVFTTLPPLSASIARTSTTGSALSLTIACAGGSGPGQCAGDIRLTSRAAPKKTHGAGSRHQKQGAGKLLTVASGSYDVNSGSSVTVKVKLNRTGQKMLSAHYVLGATVSLRGTTPLTRAVTFRYRRIKTLISYTWSFPPGSTSATASELTVSPVPRGGSVVAICHGGGCPFSVRRFAPRHGQVVLAPTFRHNPLHPGATLQLEALAPNRVGKVDVFGIRSGQNVTVLQLCLPPGTARPSHCV